MKIRSLSYNSHIQRMMHDWHTTCSREERHSTYSIFLLMKLSSWTHLDMSLSCESALWIRSINYLGARLNFDIPGRLRLISLLIILQHCLVGCLVWFVKLRFSTKRAFMLSMIYLVLIVVEILQVIILNWNLESLLNTMIRVRCESACILKRALHLFRWYV